MQFGHYWLEPLQKFLVYFSSSRSRIVTGMQPSSHQMSSGALQTTKIFSHKKSRVREKLPNAAKKELSIINCQLSTN